MSSAGWAKSGWPDQYSRANAVARSHGAHVGSRGRRDQNRTRGREWCLCQSPSIGATGPSKGSRPRRFQFCRLLDTGILAGSRFGNHDWGVGMNPTRTALLDVLQSMGADITVNMSDRNDIEPQGTIAVSYTHLRAHETKA